MQPVTSASGDLEEAIEAIGRRADFQIAAHDVVLRGACERCAGGHA
jgi:Fe2+ or Zn2+ uptake regulation protein